MPESSPPAPGSLAESSAVWLVFDAWLRRASEVIGGSTEALNAMNVFPISDADTGTNLQLTLAGIVRAVPDVTRAGLDTVVQAAILSAHGSSGAIVAEMFSSVCRSLQHPPAGLVSAGAGARIALLLRTVADAARQAVAQPVAGTILTVAEDAARAAERAGRDHPEDGLAVARAAQAEARLALQRTPDQLDVLAEAGVVDAGGQAYALLVDALVEVLGGEPAIPLTAGRAARPQTRTRGVEYEVMYALHGAGPDALAALRERLSELGHSVVVVGQGGAEGGTGGAGAALAQVHLHLAEPGAAVEAALGLGRLSQVRINVLEPTAPARHAVVAVVAGAGLARLAIEAGAVAVLTGGPQPVADALAAALADADGDVVILPNDMETLEAASHLVARERYDRRRPPRASRRLAVVPTVAQVQGLAALAVHVPDSDFDTAVTAMSAAAGHARHGAVAVAESETMTMTGRCRPGQVLGAVESDVVEVGEDLLEVSWRVVQRLLAGGGELLTLVLGADAPPTLADELTRRADRHAPDLDVQVVDGGQPRYPLLVGLE